MQVIFNSLNDGFQVVEGGVTRQIARAMEVLNASGPGARVRVMRAAYHSSAGPGAPASSYMVHSSRRVSRRIQCSFSIIRCFFLSHITYLPILVKGIVSTYS